MTYSLLTVEQAASRVGLSVSTLNKYRMGTEGPLYVRMGRRRIGYRPEDLDRWLADNTHRSTGEYIRARP